MTENFKNESGIIVGIDASRNRSGGAKVHLNGILSEVDPHKYGIKEIHVWAYQKLLDAIPNSPWLIKHNPSELEQSLIRQIWWQWFYFPREAKQAGCSIIFNTDAGTVSNFKPSVTISRDMLSYEPGEIERFGYTKARLRLIILRYIQNRSFRLADGVIFLTKHASDMIQASCGLLNHHTIIPHGVGEIFKEVGNDTRWLEQNKSVLNCVYVSETSLHKHQWNVVKAIETLRKKNFKIDLLLIGGAGGGQHLLEKQISISDPENHFVRQMPSINNSDLPKYLADADIFVFASSCENLPNTLLEAMAVGIPIASSNRGPMPEVLQDGGVYFNPDDPTSIAETIEQIIIDSELRDSISSRAKKLANKYSWKRCADETFSFISEIFINRVPT